MRFSRNRSAVSSTAPTWRDASVALGFCQVSISCLSRSSLTGLAATWRACFGSGRRRRHSCHHKSCDSGSRRSGDARRIRWFAGWALATLLTVLLLLLPHRRAHAWRHRLRGSRAEELRGGRKYYRLRSRSPLRGDRRQGEDMTQTRAEAARMLRLHRAIAAGGRGQSLPFDGFGTNRPTQPEAERRTDAAIVSAKENIARARRSTVILALWPVQRRSGAAAARFAAAAGGEQRDQRPPPAAAPVQRAQNDPRGVTLDTEPSGAVELIRGSLDELIDRSHAGSAAAAAYAQTCATQAMSKEGSRWWARKNQLRQEAVANSRRSARTASLVWSCQEKRTSKNALRADSHRIDISPTRCSQYVRNPLDRLAAVSKMSGQRVDDAGEEAARRIARIRNWPSRTCPRRGRREDHEAGRSAPSHELKPPRRLYR